MTHLDSIKYKLQDWRSSTPVGRAVDSITRTDTIKGRRTISFVCFHTLVSWWDGHLPSGTGGSEQAVVELARSFVKRGWQVFVYNNCVRERRLNGVVYVPSWKFNAQSSHDVVVLWRSGALAQYGICCSLLCIWLHDVVSPEELDDKVVSASDKIIVLSQSHRRSISHVPDDKIFVSQNAIDDESIRLFANADSDSRRNRGMCVYTSAPDRGLECLIRLWPEISRRVPGCRLYAYYGWTSWQFHHGASMWDLSWKSRVKTMIADCLSDDYVHLSQADVAKVYMASDLWLYPTQFPETSCISAMKAQAAGAIPIVTGTGALQETVKFGSKIYSDSIYFSRTAQLEFIEKVVEQLSGDNSAERRAMSQWALATFSWDMVAAQWEDQLIGCPGPVTPGGADWSSSAGKIPA